MTVKDYIFFTKHHAWRKILTYKLCRVVDPSKKVPDLNCEVQDLLLEVVGMKQEVPDLRSVGFPLNLTPGYIIIRIIMATNDNWKLKVGQINNSSSVNTRLSGFL